MAASLMPGQAASRLGELSFGRAWNFNTFCIFIAVPGYLLATDRPGQ